MNPIIIRFLLYLLGIILLLTACQSVTQDESFTSSSSTVSSSSSQIISEEISNRNLSLLPSPTDEETTPELFLAAQSEDELLQFVDAAYSAIGGPGKKNGFSSPIEIDSDGLLSFFFRTTDDRAFYKEEVGKEGESKRYYLIPLETVISHLDRYFGEYEFRLEDTDWAEEYNMGEKQFVSRSFVGWGDSIVWKVDDAETRENKIFITANQLDPTDSEKILATGTVQLLFDNQELRFLSFQYQRY